MSAGVRKNKVAFEARARRLGVWEAYVREREGWKAEGKTPEEIRDYLIPAVSRRMDAMEQNNGQEGRDE